MDEAHPWSPKRWFIEIIHREVSKKFPNCDNKVFFPLSVEVGSRKWEKMTGGEKLRFIQCSEIDDQKLREQTRREADEIKEELTEVDMEEEGIKEELTEEDMEEEGNEEITEQDLKEEQIKEELRIIFSEACDPIEVNIKSYF